MEIETDKLIKDMGLLKAVKEIERAYLAEALAVWPTHTAAARSLGLRRTTYMMKLKAHGIFVSKTSGRPNTELMSDSQEETETVNE